MVLTYQNKIQHSHFWPPNLNSSSILIPSCAASRYPTLCTLLFPFTVTKTALLHVTFTQAQLRIRNKAKINWVGMIALKWIRCLKYYLKLCVNGCQRSNSLPGNTTITLVKRASISEPAAPSGITCTVNHLHQIKLRIRPQHFPGVNKGMPTSDLLAPLWLSKGRSSRCCMKLKQTRS